MRTREAKSAAYSSRLSRNTEMQYDLRESRVYGDQAAAEWLRSGGRHCSSTRFCYSAWSREDQDWVAHKNYSIWSSKIIYNTIFMRREIKFIAIIKDMKYEAVNFEIACKKSIQLQIRRQFGDESLKGRRIFLVGMRMGFKPSLKL